MKKTFKAQHISCISCANLINAALGEEFGTIEVNLETTPKEVTLEITSEEKEVIFIEEMADIGFDIIEE